MHRNTEESACDSFFPGIVEFDPSDFAQNVYAHRSNSNLIDHLLLSECVRSDSIMLEGSTKLLECCNHTTGILRGIVYPHVEVFGVTRLPVLHDREAADDQIFDLK